MDSVSETWKLKAFLGVLLLFLISTYFAFSELMYLVRGRDGTGTITEVQRVTKRGKYGRNRGEELRVEYRFTDADNNARTGSDTVSTDWTPPPNMEVAIRYRPGATGSSRLAGKVAWLWIGLFAAGLGAVGFFGFRLLREANAAYERPGKRRR